MLKKIKDFEVKDYDKEDLIEDWQCPLRLFVCVAVQVVLVFLWI